MNDGTGAQLRSLHRALRRPSDRMEWHVIEIRTESMPITDINYSTFVRCLHWQLFYESDPCARRSRAFIDPWLRAESNQTSSKNKGVACKIYENLLIFFFFRPLREEKFFASPTFNERFAKARDGSGAMGKAI